MLAVVTHDFGSAPTVAEVGTPDAGPGEVRVRVRASSLNGFDLATFRGYFNGIFEHRFPVVLGRDFAGTVDQVGEGVTAFREGDDVFGVVLTQPLGAGGFGEYLVVPEDHNIARIPAGVDHATAGALGLAGAAAVATLAAVAAQPGETVLVSGATGGVGAIAVQRLVEAGANVIATAHGEAEVEHVRGLGATQIVDYTEDLGQQVKAIAPQGVDIALHLAGDPAALLELVADGGRFATLLGLDPTAFTVRGISATSVVATPVPAVLDALAADVATGRLRIPIQRSYGLSSVPSAFEDFAAGTLGKLVVTID